MPAAVTIAGPDWASWVLTATAMLSLAWAVRDAVSAKRERRSAARYSHWVGKETLQ
jgi:hypothetical protein